MLREREERLRSEDERMKEMRRQKQLEMRETSFRIDLEREAEKQDMKGR